MKKTSPEGLKTPVLLILFNRMETTERVFGEVRNARPRRLYVAADGPREDRPGEEKTVSEVRRFVLDGIDWKCSVKTLFREKNLGCKYGPSSAISWFFDHEECGIVLEDDCLPGSSFFRYCEELLERYRDDERIMLISGFNRQDEWNAHEYDYFFSALGGTWGWASWRRAWKHFDLEMKELDEFARKGYFEMLFGKRLGKLRRKQMTDVILKNMDAWDYQWGFARHMNSGLTCVPGVNLVRNIGFGENATHTTEGDFSPSTHELHFPLRENRVVVADGKYDELFFGKPGLLRRFYGRLFE